MAPFENVTFANHTLANSTITTGSLEASSQNQLTWQSAFWSIAAIALTTMADAPGIIYGYPKEFTFYLKLSPLTCFVDTLCFLFSTVELATRPGSECNFLQAVDQLTKQKLGSTTAQSSDIPRSPIRFILFVFGAVPQAVKIFACRGVLFTQIISSCYLASFFVGEIVLMFGRKYNELDDGMATSLKKRDTLSEVVCKARAFRYHYRDEFHFLSIWVLPLMFAWMPYRHWNEMTAIHWMPVVITALLALTLCSSYGWALLKNQTRRQQSNSSANPQLYTANEDEILTSAWHKAFEMWMTRILIWSMLASLHSVFIILLGTRLSGSSRAAKFQTEVFQILSMFLAMGCFVYYPSGDVMSGHSLPHGRKFSVKDEASGATGFLMLFTGSAGFSFVLWLGEFTDELEAKVENSGRFNKLFGTMVAILFVLMTAGVLILRSRSVKWLVVKQDHPESRSFPLITYCSSIMLASTVYYYYMYNPTATYRPSWTDWLG